MSADKHKGLASRAAYLRMAIVRDGFAVNVKWAHPLTDFVMRMIDDGELVMRRSMGGGRKNVSTVHATPAGVARLAALELRFGADFGSTADIGRVEPKRIGKLLRRRAATPPEARHVLRAHRDARIARAIAFRKAVEGTTRQGVTSLAG